MTTQSNTKDIHKLLAAQVLAGFSQWIDIFLIFSVPSFVWKSSPGEIAALASFFGLPGLFLGPIFGAFLDRSNPRRLMLAGAFLRTALSVAIAMAGSFNLFAALVLLKGLSNLLYWPSGSVVANQVVGADQRVGFYSNLSALDQLTKISTPVLAGAIALALPMQWLFLLSALSTAIGAVLVWRLPANSVVAPNEQPRTFSGLIRDLFVGFRSMAQLPSDLKIGIVVAISMSLALAIYDPHLAAFFSSLNFPATAYSVVVSSTAVGAFTGATFVRLIWKKAEPIELMKAGVALFCLAVLSVTCVIHFLPTWLSVQLLALVWFFNGLGYELFAIGSNVLIQNLCPPTLLGRIGTSMRSLQLGAVVLGPVIGAWFIERSGRVAPFATSSMLAIALLLVGAAWRPIFIVSRKSATT